jgi:hypothetical protein
MLLPRMSAAIDRTPSLASQLPQWNGVNHNLRSTQKPVGAGLPAMLFHHTPICTIFSVSGSP